MEERFRSWRDEREERDGGRDERFRNVLGREIEITLFCGEHLIPCHEHGVGDDEFHEERELPEERRESRVSPSGDKAESGGGMVVVRVMIKKVIKIETLFIFDGGKVVKWWLGVKMEVGFGGV